MSSSIENVQFEELTQEGSDAFDRVRDYVESVEKDELVARNINVSAAVGAALTTYARVKPLRAQLVKEVGGFDVSYLDELPDAALALEYVDRMVRRQRFIPKMVYEKGAVMRKRLFVSASGLAEGGLLDPDTIQKVAKGSSAAQLAQSLLDLVDVLRTNWEEIHNKTWISEDDLANAKIQARKLQLRVELLARGDASGNLEQLREQAFTLLVQWYDQVRRAVAYLRWSEGDAQQLAPSLFRRNRRRGRAAAAAEGAEDNASPSGSGGTDGTELPSPSASTVEPAESPATPVSEVSSIVGNAGADSSVTVDAADLTPPASDPEVSVSDVHVVPPEPPPATEVADVADSGGSDDDASVIVEHVVGEDDAIVHVVHED